MKVDQEYRRVFGECAYWEDQIRGGACLFVKYGASWSVDDQDVDDGELQDSNHINFNP